MVAATLALGIGGAATPGTSTGGIRISRPQQQQPHSQKNTVSPPSPSPISQDTSNKDMQRIWDAAQAYTLKKAVKIADEPNVEGCKVCGC